MPYCDAVDIRIGIQNTAREIAFETSQTAAEITDAIAAALDAGQKYLQLKDDRGRLFIVPVGSLGYVEVGAEEARRVGFVA